MSASNVEDIYELSPLQAGMLFHTLYAPEAALYFEQVTLTFEMRLDRAAFDRAWRDVVARNPILRTSFHWEGIEKALQIVHLDVEVEIRHVDLTGTPRAARAKAVEELLRADRIRGFDLRRAPLFRVAALRMASAAWHLVLSFHHILLDGWSLPLLFREFSALYEAHAQGLPPRLETRRPYSDYIGWLQQQDLGDAETFWRASLADYAGPSRLGVDRLAPAPDTPEQFSDRFLPLTAGLTAALQAFCRREQITMNTLVQAAWALVLARYGGTGDVVFGAIVSGRPPQLPGVESMIGMFLNTIPVRIRLRPEETVGEWLRSVQAGQFEARRFEHTPLIQLQAWTDVPRGTPLFETIVVFENYPRGATPGARPQQPVSDARAFERTNYPLCLIAGLAPDLQFRLLYDGRRFEAATVERMLTHVAAAIEALTDPTQPLGRVSFLPAEERRALIEDWSRSASAALADRCIHELFNEQAARIPNAPAVVDGGRVVTYAELQARSLALARTLRAAGAGPESLIGIGMERSVEQIVALVGVLQAGAAYVPLDLSHPRERTAGIIADAGIEIVLATGETRVADGTAVVQVSADGSWTVEPPLAGLVWPGNLAYVIYTSGSTGRPKGVMGEHRAALNRFAWMWRARPFEAGEICAVKTPLVFVDSIWEIFGPLLAGTPIALIREDDAREPFRLIDALARAGATRVIVVPSLLRALLESGADLAAKLAPLAHWTVSRRNAARRSGGGVSKTVARGWAAEPVRVVRGRR